MTMTTKDEYVEYFGKYLRQNMPAEAQIVLGDGCLMVIKDGIVGIGYPVVCKCGEETCMGWQMLRVMRPLGKA